MWTHFHSGGPLQKVNNFKCPILHHAPPPQVLVNGLYKAPIPGNYFLEEGKMYSFLNRPENLAFSQTFLKGALEK